MKMEHDTILQRVRAEFKVTFKAQVAEVTSLRIVKADTTCATDTRLNELTAEVERLRALHMTRKTMLCWMGISVAMMMLMFVLSRIGQKHVDVVDK